MTNITSKTFIDNPEYQIYSNGKIYSKPRKIFLKGTPSNGYLSVTITIKGKRKKILVHRLVAIYFIPRVSGKNFVNHKDGNKLNNDVENLEWVTRIENANHAVKMGFLNHERMKKPVLQIDSETKNIIAEYESIQNAFVSTGINKNSIGIVCRNGRLKTAGGYGWKYKNSHSMPQNAVVIPNFPLYMITQEGNVFSLRHNIFLSPTQDDSGYLSVGLHKDGKKYTKRINRLMIEVFGSLKEGQVVNHKDSDRKNNSISNLEACTSKENARHAYNSGKSKAMKKEIKQVDNKGNTIKIFDSIADAKRETGCLHISEVCSGKRKQTGGYFWSYVHWEVTEDSFKRKG